MKKYNKWTKQQLEYLVLTYPDNTISPEEIAEKLQRTWHNIIEKARHLGLERKSPRKRPMNDKYLDNIDTHEKAYILGILWADGCNHVDKGMISLSLKYDDEYLLHKIANLFDYEPLITRSENQRVLNLYGEGLSKTLESYGMVARKSLVLEFPTIIKDEFINSFILGEFDGDGSVWKRKQGNSCDMAFIGSKGMMEGISYTLQRLCGIRCPKIVKKLNIYYIRYTRKSDIKIIKEFMYKDCPLFLKRKREVFEGSEFVQWKVGNYNRKLTEEQVKELREKLKNCKSKKTNLAGEYGISPQTLSNIKSGKSYKRF